MAHHHDWQMIYDTHCPNIAHLAPGNIKFSELSSTREKPDKCNQCEKHFANAMPLMRRHLMSLGWCHIIDLRFCAGISQAFEIFDQSDKET